VVDLVDPYSTKDTATTTAETLGVWLRAHPGRWAMFSEGEHGLDGKLILAAGFEVAQRSKSARPTRRIYARLPHPLGESLSEALARTKDDLGTYPADLPTFRGQDSFNWTKEELELACRAAREKLFPVHAGGGLVRKK